MPHRRAALQLLIELLTGFALVAIAVQLLA